ncbi:MAG: AAA family ATPase [Proteobacteria bacterium]|nr:AAA family ATPase [Pseudomonadota bacterium]MCP4917116.1 AAA family ATPase [Pseudomonadota bacterium]
MKDSFDIADLVFGRVVLISGKGGVGKTSTAAALGRLAAAQGRKVCIVEADAQRSALGPLFGAEVGYQPVEVEPNLSICNVTWYEAMHEWIERVVPSARIVDMILANPLVRLFLDATPGNREVVTLSKLTWLRDDFDLLIVDLPASGHAMALMASPARTLSLFRVGPLHARSVESLAMLESPDTHLVLVALPEEMVVNETVETFTYLKNKVAKLSVPLVVLNRASRPSLSADERTLLDRMSEVIPQGDDAESELLLAGRWEARLEVATGSALERLANEVGVAVIDVPRLSQEHGSARLVQNLAAALARTSSRSLSR